MPSLRLQRCKLVMLKGASRGSEYVVDRPVIRVGKGEDNDIVLPDETVSRHHFEIIQSVKGYLLRDLRSTNGTFLDGSEVNEAYVRAGSVVAAGAVEFKFLPFEERIQILPSEKEQLGVMIGRSLPIRQIFGLVERIAPTDATVLIEGETGTGKDMIARTIHQLSSRCDAPFVVVDCGAVSGNLIESELFGHEKGAFTGAVSQRLGAFESAHGGTVFLDELGELPLDLQPKLLRVLEQREIQRVGSSKTVKVDFRVLAATRMDLRSQIAKGAFREDLFFRLNVVPILSPALRTRKDDIPLLCQQFIQDLSGDTAQPLSHESLAALMAHDWPGNVRELRNVLERAVALRADPAALVSPGAGGLGGLSDRESTTSQEVADANSVLFDFEPGVAFREQKERWNDTFESRYLRWLLASADGNVSRAARSADMDRKYLHKLLKKHNIDPREI